MSIAWRRNKLVIDDDATVEDAEALVELLAAHPDARLDLATCTHLHTACLQALMAAGAQVSRWPVQEDLRGWLEPILSTTA